MLDKSGKVRPDVHSNITGMTHSLLSICVQRQQTSYVSFLLDHGADPNHVIGTGTSKLSLLELAITTKTTPYQLGKRKIEGSGECAQTPQKTEAMVEALLACPDIEIDNPSKLDGYTPLTLACLNGYTRIMQMLIDKGANPSLIPVDIRLKYIKNALSTPAANEELILKLMREDELSFEVELTSAEGTVCLKTALDNNYDRVLLTLVKMRAELGSNGLKKVMELNKREIVAAYQEVQHDDTDAVSIDQWTNSMAPFTNYQTNENSNFNFLSNVDFSKGDLKK